MISFKFSFSPIRASTLVFLAWISGFWPMYGEDLVDFSKGDWIKKGPLEDVVVKESSQEFGAAAVVETGLNSPWPSFHLFPDAPWNLAGYGEISVPVKNLDKEPMMLYCKLVSISPSGSRKVSTFITLVEGERLERITIPLLPLTEAGTLKPSDFFGMRGLPFFGSEGVHPEKVEKIVFFIYKPSRIHRFALGNITTSGQPIRSQIPKNPFPFIDRFGQFMHKSWPGKIASVSEYALRRRKEDEDLKANPPPDHWNRFGGSKLGLKFPARGSFRVEKIRGKWIFLDPDGAPFFSHGINCVGPQDDVGMWGRSNWFQSIPPDSGATGIFFSDPPAWLSPGSAFYGKSQRVFNFFRFNLSEKYGDRWSEEFLSLTRRRLPSWGLNTVGNWSVRDLRCGALTPYTATTYSAGPSISVGGSPFPDPFDPAFRIKTRERFHQEVGPVAEDPWCLGVFVDNERPWGDGSGLAHSVVSSPKSTPAKIALLGILREKYRSVDHLNVVWGSSYSSWESLLESTNRPPDPAHADMTNFCKEFAISYFKNIKEMLQEVAPRRLYLGCRFAACNPLVVAAAGMYCDVVSFNVYSRSPNFMSQAFADAGDRPVMVGEFHFGALDRGLFHGGLVPVKNQAERASAYENYVFDCLKHPQIVGCHWFQYVDEPAVGRVLDGENYQIGFVDVVDQPYPELVAASRKVGASLYQTRSP